MCINIIFNVYLLYFENILKKYIMSQTNGFTFNHILIDLIVHNKISSEMNNKISNNMYFYI